MQPAKETDSGFSGKQKAEASQSLQHFAEILEGSETSSRQQNIQILHLK